MSFLRREDNNLKLFNWTICKVKYKNKQTKFYALGIPVFKIHDKFDNLRAEFARNNKFDTTKFDKKIVEITNKYKNIKTCHINENRIAFLATKIYDMGGHTKWLRDMEKTLAYQYEETLFLTTKRTSIKAAPQTINYLQKFSAIKMFDQFSLSSEHNIREIYDSIISYAPQALFVFIHPDDFIATAVLALIRKYTDIKVFFVNHATHHPALAMSLCDLILEETPSSAYITQKLRNLKQTHIVGLISKSEDENPKFSNQEISEMRQKIGVPQGAFCTMSGAASYKFFENKGKSSSYFKMIKKMLGEHPNVYHVVITALQDHEKLLMHKMFDNSPVKNRLILMHYQKNYELVFKCADLFIDSFPMGSAVAMIDLMRLKVPYVVKINTENSALSFHEYQAPDFPYMYKTVEKLYQGIKDLIKNKKKRLGMIEKNYNHYVKSYEPRAAEKILQNVIKCNDYKKLYDKLNPKIKYSIHTKSDKNNL